MSAADRIPTELDCKAAATRVWDYLDRELDAGTSDDVAHHVDTCTRCAPHFAFARRVVEALAAARGDRRPVPEPLRQRVLAALAAEGYVAGDPR